MPVHLVGTENTVAPRNVPGSTAVLCRFVGVLLFFLVADLPERDGTGTLALVDLCPKLRPLSVCRSHAGR